MKKIKAAFVCAAALIISLGSCASDAVVHDQTEQTQITLSWWGNDSRTEYTLKGVRLFEELHPEIKVVCSYSEWTGYEARNRIRMFSDTESDVMQINVAWLSQFSEDGTGYYDLSSVSDILDLSNFPQEVLRYGMSGGILNAVPIAMNTETVYINKTIYDKYGLGIPSSWEALFDAAKAMKKDSIYPLSGVSKSIWLYSLAYTEQTTGKRFIAESGNAGFTAEDMRVMIEFYVRMVEEGVIPKVEDFKKSNIDNGTYAGTVAWVSDAVNYCGGAQKNGDTVIAADYTAYSPDRSGEGWYEKPATLYAISKNTEHPHEAAMLLDFLLNSKEMALLQGVEKGIPISASALAYLEEADLLSGIQYEASQVMAANTGLGNMDPLLENSELINRFIDACNLVLFDKADPQDAALQFYEDYLQALS